MFLNGFTKGEKDAFYALAKGLIAADGILDDRETALLDEYLDEMGLSIDEIAVMTVETAIEALKESEKSVRRKAFIELVSLSMCDESFDENENHFLECLGEGLSIPQSEAAELTDCVVKLLGIYEKMGKLIANQD